MALVALAPGQAGLVCDSEDLPVSLDFRMTPLLCHPIFLIGSRKAIDFSLCSFFLHKWERKLLSSLHVEDRAGSLHVCYLLVLIDGQL